MFSVLKKTILLSCVASMFPFLCQHSSAQIETETQRADKLLSKMTTQQKIGQLNQVFDVSNLPGMPQAGIPVEEQVRRGQLGSILFVTDPVKINRLQKIAVEESPAHIPLLFGFDVIHGWDTEFPVPIGMAASWDPDLVENVQTAAAREASHAGIRWSFAPMLDIARDPRWGRISEGAGEDPFLGAAMARAQVYGFQGRPGTPTTFLATLKHFAGYGAAEGGRDYDAAYIPEEQLHNVYLRPFQAGIDAGAATVMSAYMDLNDVPATGNVLLLRDLLRKEMGFTGFVVSDAFAVGDLVTHGFARDNVDAAYRAARAGVNMDMGSLTYLSAMQKAIDQSQISESQLDDLVRPILEAKFRIGLFEHPYGDATVSTHADMLIQHRGLARAAAAEAAVMLRNEGALLPLSKTTKRIAVIGPLGNSQADLNGPWSLTANPADTVTPYAAIQAKLPGAAVKFAQGVQIAKLYPSMFDSLTGPKPEPKWAEERADAEMKKAIDAANHSDVVVMALGELALMDFEYASRSSLDLPGRQQELLEKIATTGKPIVLLLFSTRPLNVSWASNHVPAIIDCFFGGTEGGNGIADLLFGDRVPSGKLPVSWPRSAGQIPVYYAHNLSHKPYDAEGVSSRYWDLPTSPLYPFGFGLSYSTFQFGDIHVSNTRVRPHEIVTASATVTNTGKVEADNVVQLYLHQRSGSASRPVRELKGFQRIHLRPGESRIVTFHISEADRTFWSETVHEWVLESADFDVWIGDSSEATLHSTFSVEANQ